MIKQPERKPLDRLLEVTRKITNPDKRREEKQNDKTLHK